MTRLFPVFHRQPHWALLWIAMLAGFLVCALAAETSTANGAKGEMATEPKLRKDLLARKDADQKIRFEMLRIFQKLDIQPGRPITNPQQLAKVAAIQKRLRSIDDKNRKWLQSVIDKHGWPGRSLVGKDGAYAAWLLVQHADRDRAFQKKSLQLMMKMPKGEVDRKNVAYLTDRVLVGENKKQRFGTQLKTNKKGKLEPLPVEDIQRVDQLRQEMGLRPLAEYLEFAQKQMDKKR